MTHDEIMASAVKLAAAFIQNGDLRHDKRFKPNGNGDTQEQVQLLVMQMYCAVEQASHDLDITEEQMAEINLDAMQRHGFSDSAEDKL